MDFHIETIHEAGSFDDPHQGFSMSAHGRELLIEIFVSDRALGEDDPGEVDVTITDCTTAPDRVVEFDSLPEFIRDEIENIRDRCFGDLRDLLRRD